MGMRLGLRRVAGRLGRGERYEVEEENYEDLRDLEDMIDLSEYYTTESRTREAVAYLDLASAILAAEAEEMNDPELALP